MKTQNQLIETLRFSGYSLDRATRAVNKFLNLQRFTVSIRRDIGKAVRPTAEKVDGASFMFRFGWEMDDEDPYPWEIAWLAHDEEWPKDAPGWIASGDLTPNS